MDSDAIDQLLERYLHLLHEYTSLREQLNSLQSGVFQNIARANFSAERGLRYGPDHYDDRMQASRTLRVVKSSKGPLTFEIASPRVDETPSSKSGDADSGKQGGTPENSGEDHEQAKETKSSVEPPQAGRDPLRWFGLLTPQVLRQAQAQSIQAIEQVVPKLASLSIEMAEVEIEVRRARKRRTKAEVAVKKEQEVITSAEIAS